MSDTSGRGAIVISGASSGLGEGFARRFAAAGEDVVLVARRAERLERLAAELHHRYAVRAEVITLDLRGPAAADELLMQLRQRGLFATGLVNSAGFGTAGLFIDEDAARLADQIAVNVTALTLITRALLPDLLASRGLLVNVSSTASHQPLPRMAVYAATKAFVTSLTEAIWYETRGDLRVLALCPGPTETEFFAAAGSEEFKIGAVATVDEVLDGAFRILERPHPGPVHTVGARNRLQGWAARVAPRRLRLSVASALGGQR
ncbi:SDR family NAD(P)-dependent oxidoreductase [Microbacterium sp. ZW T5_45]|uniref:SDR family NAD(P)-dependent oxidoreductase n=1 Tax=Microbacterium sp. ZW T5_45 TaxID=3378080 RepID=UPI003852FFAE